VNNSNSADNKTVIAGVDEAGRGPLAGPVVVSAVILDPNRPISGLRDSKTLSSKHRHLLDQQIREQAKAFSIVMVSAAEIDGFNIFRATLFGMTKAIQALEIMPDEVWIDGAHIPPNLGYKARAIVRGDALEPVISAASILAKVARDQWMENLDQRYPGYGFAKHKGYPTRGHLAALDRLGPCLEHRRSFAPVRQLFLNFQGGAALAGKGKVFS